MVKRKLRSLPNHPLAIALLAALCFGAATPASKALLQALPTFQLAGLLYLGAAMGVVPLLIKEKGFSFPWHLDHKTAYRLLGAICLGGVAGPLLLLFGLTLASAASVSLWLNLELIATVTLGFLIFRDELHLAGWSATIGVLAAATLLSFSEGHAGIKAGLLVGAACLCWGLDNHFTALITSITPAQTTFWKGLVAGIVNLSIGIYLDSYSATFYVTSAAILVGVFSYGFSLVLYIASAQKLGAARSQVIFLEFPVFWGGPCCSFSRRSHFYRSDRSSVDYRCLIGPVVFRKTLPPPPSSRYCPRTLASSRRRAPQSLFSRHGAVHLPQPLA